MSGSLNLVRHLLSVMHFHSKQSSNTDSIYENGLKLPFIEMIGSQIVIQPLITRFDLTLHGIHASLRAHDLFLLCMKIVQSRLTKTSISRLD